MPLFNEETLRLRDLLLSRRRPGEPLTLSLVGGGGKTSTLFALARAFRVLNLRVLASTTTRILDPQSASEREGRGFAPLLLESGQEENALLSDLAALASTGGAAVLGQETKDGKLSGVGGALISRVSPLFDVVLVEADGSKGLPIKAPGDREPVLAPSSDAVIALIGLDALGQPLSELIAHRPELLSGLCGCPLGAPLGVEHLARLSVAPGGSFKSCPPGALKVLLLNKADLVTSSLRVQAEEATRSAGGADLVMAASMGLSQATSSYVS